MLPSLIAGAYWPSVKRIPAIGPASIASCRAWPWPRSLHPRWLPDIRPLACTESVPAALLILSSVIQFRQSFLPIPLTLGTFIMPFHNHHQSGDLDHVLTGWSDSDPWTVRMLCQHAGRRQDRQRQIERGGGLPARGPWSAPTAPAALAAHPSPRTAAYVQRGCSARSGRSRTVHFRAGRRCRFNFLDYEREHGADVRDLTQACMMFKETLSRTEGGGGGGEAATTPPTSPGRSA